LLAVATAYREAVVGGAVDLTQEPETPAEAARVFQFKRKMVEAFVTRVDVLANKTTRVTLDLIFPEASPDVLTRSHHSPTCGVPSHKETFVLTRSHHSLTCDGF
jgi:hypothetical protein